MMGTAVCTNFQLRYGLTDEWQRVPYPQQKSNKERNYEAKQRRRRRNLRNNEQPEDLLNKESMYLVLDYFVDFLVEDEGRAGLFGMEDDE